jgi:hypothetical protein
LLMYFLLIAQMNIARHICGPFQRKFGGIQPILSSTIPISGIDIWWLRINDMELPIRNFARYYCAWC